MDDQTILANEIPRDLFAEVVQDIATYSVGFVVPQMGISPNEPLLLGSGTFISYNGKRVIITARHVVDSRKFPTSGRIGLMLSGSVREISIDVGSYSIIRIERGNVEKEGPDLAMLVLAPAIASTLAARQSFFPLDLFQGKEEGRFDPVIGGELWVAQGYVDKYTIKGESHGSEYPIVRYYNFSGFGCPTQRNIRGSFDYLSFPTESHDEYCIPDSFGGMSGGALWRIPLKKEGDKLTYTTPVFSGVIFYEESTSPGVGNLICHGWESVYRHCCNLIDGI